MIAQNHKTSPAADTKQPAAQQQKNSLRWVVAHRRRLSSPAPILMRVVGLSMGVMTVMGLVATGLAIWFTSTYLPPNVVLGGVPVGLTTYDSALDQYHNNAAPLPSSIVLGIDGLPASQSATLSAEQLALSEDPNQALLSAFDPGRSVLEKLVTFVSVWHNYTSEQPMIVDVPVYYDQTVISQTLNELAAAAHRDGTPPSIKLKTSGVKDSLQIESGTLGRELDSTASVDVVNQQLQQKHTTLTLPTLQTGKVLSYGEVEALRERAAGLVGKHLDAVAEQLSFSLNDQAMIALLDPTAGWNESALTEVVGAWQKQVGTQPQEPVLDYDPTTLKVSQFTPPRNGRTIQALPTKKAILEGLSQLIADDRVTTVTKNLSIEEAPPQTSLASLNNLGLRERIGFGESRYAHSIPNRIHNVAITAERINNTIVPPGAEFSFNKTVGDVSAATGYKSAYVIKDGKTELGDGGGVCQVSTTLFRSVLDAGLKVTRRLPHSYRVSYYELDRKPGIDATVYAGNVDFRFINDTPDHILIHTVTDSKNTYMYTEIYGTSDGRHTEIVDHKTWDARPAPPPQYFPDPTLPPGKVVQIDWAAPGIRTSFTNVIYDANNTEIRRDTYVSNYQPWAAKYLQGIAP